MLSLDHILRDIVGILMLMVMRLYTVLAALTELHLVGLRPITLVVSALLHLGKLLSQLLLDQHTLTIPFLN